MKYVVNSKVKIRNAKVLWRMLSVLLLLFTVHCSLLTVLGQSTEFTYQGQLQSSSSPGNGNFDFEFALFDAVGGGAQVGSTLTRSSVAVANGIFSVNLDFGSGFPGAGRFLEVRVRQTGGGGFTTLSPRQPVTSSPYAIKSIQSDSSTVATNAITANNATTANNALQLGGVAAGQYVQTGDPRMTNDRAPTAGSSNYIQNQNAGPQATSNFNISGNGIIAGRLTIGDQNPSAYKLDVVHPGGLGSPGFRVKSNSSYSVVDVDASDGDAALRFLSNGVFKWNIRNDPLADSLEIVDLDSGGTRLFVQGVTGNVGIGTSNPLSRLHVGGSGIFTGSLTASGVSAFGDRLSVSGGGDAEPGSGGYLVTGSISSTNLVLDDNEIMARNNGAVSTLFLNADGGNVSIGTTAVDQRLTVNGNASKVGGGTWAVFSDERLKNINGRYLVGLDAIRQLNPIRFEYRPDNALGLVNTGQHIGFSAQEVQKIIPEAVTTTVSGYLQLNSDPILWATLNAVKEQQKTIEDQQAQINELKKLVCLSTPAAGICKEMK